MCVENLHDGSQVGCTGCTGSGGRGSSSNGGSLAFLGEEGELLDDAGGGCHVSASTSSSSSTNKLILADRLLVTMTATIGAGE